MLIEDVTHIANLSAALAHCRKGKRYSQGYQKFLLSMPGALLEIQRDILDNSYRWLPYRTFEVCDPKKRKILAAPFRDRIVHQAIYQIIGPAINATIPLNSFACRPGMGNRNAARYLLKNLSTLGPQRYTIKLDVRQYFASINHEILTAMVKEIITDASIVPILQSLLQSHPAHAATATGIPIGNVTSQCFANVYLSPIDKLAETQKELYYVRYMDDIVICGPDKGPVVKFANTAVEIARSILKLEIPFQKTVHLAGAPVPFLGFVLDHLGYRPLRRNLTRHRRRAKHLEQLGLRMSLLAQQECSFAAWSRLC